MPSRSSLKRLAQSSLMPSDCLLHPRLERSKSAGGVEPEPLEDVERARRVVGGEVLVEDEDRLDPGVLEEGVPARLRREDLVEQVARSPGSGSAAAACAAVRKPCRAASSVGGPRRRRRSSSPSAPPSRARPPGGSCSRGRPGRRSGRGRRPGSSSASGSSRYSGMLRSRPTKSPRYCHISFAPKTPFGVVPGLHRPLEVAVVGGPAPGGRRRRALAGAARRARRRSSGRRRRRSTARAARPAGAAQRLEVLLGPAGDAGLAAAPCRRACCRSAGVAQTR